MLVATERPIATATPAVPAKPPASDAAPAIALMFEVSLAATVTPPDAIESPPPLM